MRKLLVTAAVIYIRYRRFMKMTTKAMNIIKSMVIGAAAGAAVGTASCCLMNTSKRSRHKKAGHAAEMMGDLFDNMAYLFK